MLGFAGYLIPQRFGSWFFTFQDISNRLTKKARLLSDRLPLALKHKKTIQVWNC
jgi:hypothetical protein